MPLPGGVNHTVNLHTRIPEFDSSTGYEQSKSMHRQYYHELVEDLGHTKAQKKNRSLVIQEYMKNCRNRNGVQTNQDDLDEYGNSLKKCDQLCFNWVATAKCWRDPCNFAHGQEELTEYGASRVGDKYKRQNCRNFFDFSSDGTQYCKFGDNCLFRHEHRPFFKLHRRYYGLHLSKLEALYDNVRSEKAKTEFIDDYEPDTNCLKAFADIHALFEPAEVEEEVLVVEKAQKGTVF